MLSLKEDFERILIVIAIANTSTRLVLVNLSLQNMKVIGLLGLALVRVRLNKLVLAQLLTTFQGDESLLRVI